MLPFRLGTNGGANIVPAFEEGIYDPGPNESIGSGDEDGRVGVGNSRHLEQSNMR